MLKLALALFASFHMYKYGTHASVSMLAADPANPGARPNFQCVSVSVSMSVSVEGSSRGLVKTSGAGASSVPDEGEREIKYQEHRELEGSHSTHTCDRLEKDGPDRYSALKRLSCPRSYHLLSRIRRAPPYFLISHCELTSTPPYMQCIWLFYST